VCSVLLNTTRKRTCGLYNIIFVRWILYTAYVYYCRRTPAVCRVPIRWVRAWCRCEGAIYPLKNQPLGDGRRGERVRRRHTTRLAGARRRRRRRWWLSAYHPRSLPPGNSSVADHTTSWTFRARTISYYHIIYYYRVCVHPILDFDQNFFSTVRPGQHL